MNSKKVLLGALLASSSAFVLWGDATNAQTRCTAQTLSRTITLDELCGCEIVTRGLIRNLQQRDDFLQILAGTTSQCPALAFALSDVPTASVLPASTNDDGGPSNGRPSDDGPGDDGPGDDGPGDDGPGDDGPGDDGPGDDGPGDDGPGDDGPGDDGDDTSGTGKGNNGHGNDVDRYDASNPGKGRGKSRDASDDDGKPGRSNK